MKKYLVAAEAVNDLAGAVESKMAHDNLTLAWRDEICADGGSKVLLETDHDWPLRCAIWLLQREGMK